MGPSWKVVVTESADEIINIMLYFYVFLIQFYKFVSFLKSITKLVKHCNKNDEIKARVVELETAFSRENLIKKLLYGSYMGFSG